MSRRSRGSGGSGENAAMDMMSALIGCLILILIGILLIVMVAQSLIVITKPIDEDIEALIVGRVDSSVIRGSNVFPDGNKDKEPAYFDVHRDKVLVYYTDQEFVKNEFEVSIRELNVRGNALEKTLDTIESIKDEDYVILLIRPNAAALSRKIKKMVTDRGIDVGSELFDSRVEINYVESETRKLREEAKAEKAMGATTALDEVPENVISSDPSPEKVEP